MKENVFKKRSQYFKLLALKLIIIFALIAIDLITKQLFENLFLKGKLDIVVIKDVLSFTYVQNTGAAFSVFSDHTLLLAIMSVVFVIGFFVYDFFNSTKSVFNIASFVLIVGGAVGNMVDRVFLFYVRDFIRFDFINFPIFNFADICLTMGLITYAIYLFFFYNKDTKKVG